jgi:hypothetical protein
MKVPRTIVIAELRIRDFELPFSVILFFSVYRNFQSHTINSYANVYNPVTSLDLECRSSSDHCTRTSKHRDTKHHEAANPISIVKPTRCINVSNLFYWSNTPHVSDGLSVHLPEFKSVHTATGICQTDTPDC